MIVEGDNTFGEDGALMVPHAVTLHAVQVLPTLALLLLVADVSERRRIRVVALGAVGYAFLIAATMLQTYAGLGPLDPSVGSTTAAVVGLALLAASGLAAIRYVLPRLRQPTSAEG